MMEDPFPITPPSADESARVASDAALLSAAADRLERLVAEVAPLPWVARHLDGIVAAADDLEVVEMDAAHADLIAALVNAGPDLVALLRDAAREAVEVGPNGFAVALARKVMREQR